MNQSKNEKTYPSEIALFARNATVLLLSISGFGITIGSFSSYVTGLIL